MKKILSCHASSSFDSVTNKSTNFMKLNKSVSLKSVLNILNKGDQHFLCPFTQKKFFPSFIIHSHSSGIVNLKLYPFIIIVDNSNNAVIISTGCNVYRIFKKQNVTFFNPNSDEVLNSIVSLNSSKSSCFALTT